MARKPNTHAVIDTADTGINTDAVAGAMDAMRDQAQEDLVELLDLAGDVRAIQMADWTQNILRAAKVRLFDRVRESKKIKDLPIKTPAGLRRAKDIGEFCQLAFGRSYTVMFEASQSLEALGEEAYDTASRLGLNRSALRAARALPPESLETVRLAISNGSSKAEVLSVIEDLAEKIQKAESEAADLRAEREADEQVRGDLRKKIDRLERDKKRIEQLPPDEKLVLAQKDATDAMNLAAGSVDGVMRKAFNALQDLGQGGAEHNLFMAGLVAQVQAALNGLRSEFRLAEVADDAGVDPDVRAALRDGLAALRGGKSGAVQ